MKRFMTFKGKEKELKESLMKGEKFLIEDLEALRVWTSNWMRKIQLPHIILLYGSMGVGKTQFVQFLVESLQFELLQENETSSLKKEKEEEKSEAFSPSFTIHNHYKIGKKASVEHFDLFRLKNEAELENIGFWDFFHETQKIVVIEWADRIDEKCLPMNWVITKIKIKMLEAEKRYLFIL